MVEICRIFTFSQDFVFSFSSKAEQGFPDAHGARHPLALRLVSQNPFGRFVRGLGEEPPSTPLVRSSRRPLLQKPNEGSSPATTQARRPILLEEMIHKVEEQGFCSNAEKRDQVGSSQRKGVPWLPTKKGRKTSILKN